MLCMCSAYSSSRASSTVNLEEQLGDIYADFEQCRENITHTR